MNEFTANCYKTANEMKTADLKALTEMLEWKLNFGHCSNPEEQFMVTECHRIYKEVLNNRNAK